jgi:protein-disulfide isomerase
LFGDFTDSGSGELFEFLGRLQRQHPAKFRWVYKNFPKFPRPEIGMSAARLAVLASDSGKFELVAAGLFKQSQPTSRAKLIEVARRSGLEAKAIEQALADDAFEKRVIGDRRLAVRLGLRQAPAIFINGRRFKIATYQELEERFERERQRADALISNGVPLEKLYPELIRQGRVSAWLPKHSPAKAPRTRSVPNSRRDKIVENPSPKSAGLEKVFVEPGAGPGLGSREAQVQLVVFADLECTFCAKMISQLRTLYQQYPEKLRITLRQLPAIRRKDLKDAEIALVASANDKTHWAFVEKVYADHKLVDRQQVLAWAKESGLDVARLTAQLEQPGPIVEQLESNLREAKRVGVRGRPYLFVQGQRVPGAAPLAMLKRLVEESLQQKP